MGWKSSWNKPNPVEKRRRELEQEELSLSRQKAALEAELSACNGTLEAEPEPRPIVWNERNAGGFTKDEDWPARSGRSRVLSVHRYRDRNLFIALASILLVIIIFLVRAVLH